MRSAFCRGVTPASICRCSSQDTKGLRKKVFEISKWPGPHFSGLMIREHFGQNHWNPRAQLIRLKLRNP